MNLPTFMVTSFHSKCCCTIRTINQEVPIGKLFIAGESLPGSDSALSTESSRSSHYGSVSSHTAPCGGDVSPLHPASPLAGTNKHFRRDPKTLVEPANHPERQGAIAAQDFVHTGPAADDPHQRLRVSALLLQPELDGVDWIGNIDGKVGARQDAVRVHAVS
jgi:hypothetical protein